MGGAQASAGAHAAGKKRIVQKQTRAGPWMWHWRHGALSCKILPGNARHVYHALVHFVLLFFVMMSVPARLLIRAACSGQHHFQVHHLAAEVTSRLRCMQEPTSAKHPNNNQRLLIAVRNPCNRPSAHKTVSHRFTCMPTMTSATFSFNSLLFNSALHPPQLVSLPSSHHHART